MAENSKQNSLKKNKMSKKKENESYSIFDNSKKEITKEEYNNRVKNSFLFMRSSLSRPYILEIKPDSKNRKIKKKKAYFQLHLKSETNNNNKMKSFPQIKSKPEQNSYMNLQPKKTWLNCKKVFNICLKGYNPDEYSKESMFQKLNRENQTIENIKYKLGIRTNIDTLSLIDKPIISFSKKQTRNKTFKIPKNKLLFKSLNMHLNYKQKNENNFIKCMKKSQSSNFINKGINNILETRNIEDINALKEFRLGKKNKNREKIQEEKINLYSKLDRKKLSLINSQMIKLETAKKMRINLDFQYKINSFFYTVDKNAKHLQDEESDLEIVEEGGIFLIRESILKKEKLESYKENQSDFNFFCLKNIFRLDQFHIFGLISGKGKESKKCSRLLKSILIKFFSEEKNYINNEILEKNQFKQKIDYILYLLITEDFKFIKNIFNQLEPELEKMGIDIETTGATLSLIIFIKDKIISIKLGDIHPYFIYNVFDEKLKNNSLIRNPHWAHNLNNIFEQDRVEENNCKINSTINKIGHMNYKIEYTYDEEIHNILENDNIKCTRMIGYKKLRKIGILNKLDIQTFSMDMSKINDDERFFVKKDNKNSHASDYEYSKLIKKKGINPLNVILKFVLIGNDELFEVMKNSYYIKEIYEAMIKDENDGKNKNNFKYLFNIKKIIKKLVVDSAKMNKIFMNKNSLRDLSLALVIVEEC